MSLFKPDAPTPPNPIATAGAQTSANISTGVANSYLNNTNQNTPQGNLTYTSDPNGYSYTDPTTQQTYNIPRWTASQTLPSWATDTGWTGFSQDNANHAMQYNTANIGNQLSWDLLNNARAGNLRIDPNSSPYGYADPNALMSGVGDPATSFGGYGEQQTSLGDYGSAQSGIDPSGNIQSGVGGAGQQQYGFGVNGQQQFGFGGTWGGPQYNTGDAGDVTGQYGDNAGVLQSRKNVENSLFQRMQPQMDQQRMQLEQRLADQGISYGSPAYSNAMDDFNRSVNDARLAVTAQGGQEQQLQENILGSHAQFANSAQQQRFGQQAQRQAAFNSAQSQDFGQQQARGQFYNQAQQAGFDQSKAEADYYNNAQQENYKQVLQSGQFTNAAEAQQFAENKTRADFANNAQQQNFSQKVQAGQFANQAQKDQYQQAAMSAQFYNAGTAQRLQQNSAAQSAQNNARANWLNERQTFANQGINQISSLLSGSQVQAPGYVNTPNSQIANTDFAGIVNSNFNQQLGIYQSQNQNFQSLMGGIFGATGSIGKGLALSDRREKENIEKVGTVFAAPSDDEDDEKKRDSEAKVLPIYNYSYKQDPASIMHTGPMAQDVEKIDPRAVATRGGVKYINMTRMGSILRPTGMRKAA